MREALVECIVLIPTDGCQPGDTLCVDTDSLQTLKQQGYVVEVSVVEESPEWQRKVSALSQQYSLDEQVKEEIRVRGLSYAEAGATYSQLSIPKLSAIQAQLVLRINGLGQRLKKEFEPQLKSGVQVTDYFKSQYIECRVNFRDAHTRLLVVDDLLQQLVDEPTKKPDKPRQRRGAPDTYLRADTYRWYDELVRSSSDADENSIIDEIITRHANLGRGTTDRRTIRRQLRQRLQ